MKGKKIWIDLAILNLCVVAFLGVVMRSKILFSLPIINYPYLLNAHSHFAFGGWVTLALMTLMVFELVYGNKEGETIHIKSIYKWLLGGIFATSWCMLLSFPFEGYGPFSNSFSSLFIFVTYIFGWIFIKDILKTNVCKTVKLLSISSIVCLILSSAGPFSLVYLFAVHSLNAVIYRDALYTYLHFQYNGFFTLAVLALLFNKIESKITEQARKDIYRFSILICLSIIPSLFMSFLWQNPDSTFRVIAIVGSILLLISLFWFILSARRMKHIYATINPLVRMMGLFSMIAFMMKLFLQAFTVFPSVGNAVFGTRPMVIGFLHLVFLGFVTLFLLANFARDGSLNIKNKFTRIALIVFTLGVIVNEAILMSEGLAGMFFTSNYLFPSLLWVTSVWMLIGAVLIGVARMNTNKKAGRNFLVLRFKR